MTFTRKIQRKNKDGTIKTYYAEVESVRKGSKIIQRYIRSLGSDPNAPTNFPLEPVHFSYLALRLMQGSLTANDVFEMLEGMGNPVTKNDLESIGIHYDFGKKTFSIYLYYAKNSKSKSDVPDVGKGSRSIKQTKEKSKPYQEKER
jgi:hypothetical protein